MIMSIDAEKAFEQNSTSIYDKKKKKPPESGHRRNIPQHNKCYL